MVIDYIGKQHQDCHKEDGRTVEKTTRIVDFIGMYPSVFIIGNITNLKPSFSHSFDVIRSIKNGQNVTEIHYRA